MFVLRLGIFEEGVELRVAQNHLQIVQRPVGIGKIMRPNVVSFSLFMGIFRPGMGAVACACDRDVMADSSCDLLERCEDMKSGRGNDRELNTIFTAEARNHLPFQLLDAFLAPVDFRFRVLKFFLFGDFLGDVLEFHALQLVLLVLKERLKELIKELFCGEPASFVFARPRQIGSADGDDSAFFECLRQQVLLLQCYHVASWVVPLRQRIAALGQSSLHAQLGARQVGSKYLYYAKKVTIKWIRPRRRQVINQHSDDISRNEFVRQNELPNDT
jgi:hypothetical protein